MRKLVLFWGILFCCFGQRIYGQTPSLTYQSVAIKSEEYFNLLQYKELIELGNLALKAHIDFYDLRVRLGITHFRKGNYEAANIHFERAIEMNPSETVILDYGYKCLLFTGQYQRANMLLIKYPQINPSYKPKARGINVLEMEFGSIQTQNEESLAENSNQNKGNSFEGNYFSGMEYLRVYNEILLSPDAKLHIGGNLFQSKHVSGIQFFQNDITQNHSTLNYQLNMGMSKLLNRGWALGIGLGFYRQNFTHPYIASSQIPPPPNSPIVDTSEISNAISMSTFISKRMKFIEPILFLNYANFDYLDRYQAELGLTYFPFAKDKFYTFSSVSLNHSNGNTSYAYQQKIGAALLPFLTTEISFMGGNLDNYMGSMGFLTLNTFDPLNWSGGVDFKLYKGRFAFCPGYRYQERSSSFYYDEGLGNISTSNFNYNNHLFYFTIKCQL